MTNVGENNNILKNNIRKRETYLYQMIFFAYVPYVLKELMVDNIAWDELDQEKENISQYV